jgi:NifU-like protein involved in Fe-S cluster formation
MPCNNIVEQIRINLDDRNRLTGYRFIKQTCGQDVGARSLLTEFLLGLNVDELLAIDSESLLAVCRPEDDVSRFLHLKHLFAIQAALEVYTGRSNGASNSACAIAEIGDDQGQVVIDADIDVGLVADKIKACSGCSGCASDLPAFEA